MLMMDFKASNTATIATIDKGSDRTFASAFFHPPASPAHVGCCVLNRAPARPPSEIYFESRGKCCKKLLRYNGYPNKVLLYPEEGWARSAASSYWTIAPCRWRRNRCIVEEVAGSRKQSTQGRMIVVGDGALLIVGTFKRRVPDPDFKLYLSSNISLADYNMGYCLTGTLERGCERTNQYQTTHFAVIRRCWPANEHDGHHGGGGGFGVGGVGGGGSGSKNNNKTQHTYIDFLFNR
ncbi:uncharacterized protein LOC128719028 [Anopheles marshallii]|uniref:uncharacterized protein LOC128719028 n=1 Tax=Anopheles marshallii TaxID=1521116 RepID=UPI00237BB622|nr:uncharacterized protein LOC128719028 [Anopheles marshallii]